MARVLLLTFLAAEAVGFLPLYSATTWRISISVHYKRPWWSWAFEWGLCVLAVVCAVYLGREAARSWKRLGRKFLSTGSGVAVVVTAAVGFLWGWLVAALWVLVP